MSGLPKYVEIHEEGPREGIQMEPPGISLADRVALIEGLAETGLKQIQLASFVNPVRVPQMADAAELFRSVRKRDGVRYTALWLNEKGFERAASVKEVDLEGALYFYASDAFSRMNNGVSAQAHTDTQRRWIDLYRQHGLSVDTAYIMTAFGCNFEGEIPMPRLREVLMRIKRILEDEGVRLGKLYLADTVGWANPLSVRERVGLLREIFPGVRVGLHLHDTRGTGMANALAALQEGVDLFDASVAGLGGCPFSGHAPHSVAGNICTEDLVFMCHEMGIRTDVDLDRLIETAQLAQRIIGRPLNGRVMHSGSLVAFRAQAAAPKQ